MRLSAITMYSDTTQIVGVAVTYSAASLAVPPQIVSHGNTIDAFASPPLLIPRADSVAKWTMLMTPDTIYQMTFTTARGDAQTWPLEPSSDSAAGSLSSGSGPVIGFTGSSQTSSGVFVIFANLLNLSPMAVTFSPAIWSS
jgi:hypothetical protein